MENLEAIIIAVIVVIGIAYVMVIGAFTVGWFSIKTFSSGNKKPKTKISIIIAFRNENDVLKNCLDDILLQEYDEYLFEVILVNDHTTDESLQLAHDYASGNANIHLYNLPEKTFGKKSAISLGIEKSTGDLIVTTDADCRFSKYWLQEIALKYETDKPKMIIGPVAFNENKSFFASIQSLEFLSLIASGAGSLAINTPILCNGANLVYEKEAFQKVNAYTDNSKFVSGDDIFLLFKIRKEFGSKAIKFLKTYKAIVFTDPKKNLKEFLSQRIRWISKSKGYTNFEIITTSLIIYLFNYSIFMSFILGIWSLDFLYLGIILFLLKVVTDLPVYAGITSFTRKTRLLWYLIPMQILYVIYVSLIGFAGNFFKFKWKGRQGN